MQPINPSASVAQKLQQARGRTSPIKITADLMIFCCFGSMDWNPVAVEEQRDGVVAKRGEASATILRNQSPMRQMLRPYISALSAYSVAQMPPLQAPTPRDRRAP